MTRTGKKFLWALIILTLTLALFCGTASAAESGTWGELTWTLDNDGLLTISGTGGMADFSYNTTQAWLADKNEITNVIIQEGVTSIGSYAFYGCGNLTSVSLPDTVTGIGDWAFYSCGSLTDISLPDSVVSIGSLAFANDTKVYVSDIGGSTAKALGSHSFRIPGEKYDLKYLFTNGEITDLTLMDADKDIQYVTIPECVTAISRSAFFDCKNLTSVSIPDGVISIGALAFAFCDSLASVSLPDGVISIGGAAFGSKTTVYVSDIGGSTALALSNSRAFRIPGKPYDLRYTFTGDDVTGLTLSNADKDIVSAVIPDGVTSIYGSAFSGCGSLVSVSIPDTVASIGNSAFARCGSLISVSIPDGVDSIADSTFRGCGSLISVSIPDTVASIGPSAFDGCGSLISVSIPDGVDSIGDSTFRGCGSLISVSIPDGVDCIGNSAFASCGSLTSVSIPVTVTSIGNSAFAGCSSLANVIVPDGVTSIGDFAFSGCSSLTSIRLPDGITGIGSDCFAWCYKLRNVRIPDGVTSIGDYAFDCCTSLTNITIPASVTSIGFNAFHMCEKLEKAVFLHAPGSADVSFSTSSFSGTPVFWGSVPLYCYRNSPVDIWASGQYPEADLVYLDGMDFSAIRSIILQDDFKLPCGQSRALICTLFPDDHTAVAWESSNSQAVSVSNGTVTAHQPGVATITASVGALSESIQIEAYIEAVSLSLSDSEVWLTAGEELQLTAVSFEPAGASANIIWTSSDTDIAAVDQSGLVTTALPGDVMICADTVNGIHRECLIHLFPPVTSVSFGKNTVIVLLDRTVQLEAHVTAGEQSCVNRLVTFASSNEAVATVDGDGKVHGMAPGTATITAASRSGITAACIVTVRSANVLTLPSGTTAIESEAFAGLTNADVIVIPASVTSIADDAFAGSDVIIRAPAGSYAYHWAQSHGFQVQAP